MQSSGYKSRKTVIRLLSGKESPPGKKKKGKPQIIEFGRKVEKALRKLYEHIKQVRQQREETFNERNGQQSFANAN